MTGETISRSLLLLVVAILLSACGLGQIDDPIEFDKEFLNNQVLLRAPAYSNTFKTKGTIALELKYNSNHRIMFANNFNIKIFRNISNHWTEIKEKPATRIPSDVIVFSPEKAMPAVQVVMFSPDLPQPDEKYFLRVYVVGLMEANGTTKNVAAYTDIILNP
jgi:hypothetical protein